MGAGDMSLHEFKALFRTRKGKLQPGTELRLITKPPEVYPRSEVYYGWGGAADSYWRDREEEVFEVAAKYGMRLEICKKSM